MVAITLMMKKITSVQIAIAHSRSPADLSRPIASALPATGCAAIEEVAAREDQNDDAELDEAHDHRNRGGHRRVILFVSSLIGRKRDHTSIARRRPEQHGGWKYREGLHER